MKEKERPLAPKAAAVPVWEYNRIGLRTIDSLGHMNELGSQGWEFVAFDLWGTALFKRPVIQENNPQ